VERGFDFITIGIFGMIPAIFAIFGEALAGIYTDKMIKNGYSITFSRKLPIVIGLVFSSVICLTEFVDSEIMIILLLSLSFSAAISASPGIWAIPGDIAPSSSLVGTIGGIQNTFSNIAGIVAPVITGIIISEMGTFTPALILTSILAILGSLSYWFIVGELSPLKIKIEKNER
jgi:ACS family glucarate transporter-like MFS transporter